LVNGHIYCRGNCCCCCNCYGGGQHDTSVVNSGCRCWACSG
jgi:hypothetical protein